MKENMNFHQKMINGVIWKFIEKGGTQLAQFVIQLLLARLLLPEDYGIVGLLNVFILFSDIFIQQGFTSGLIQKRDADNLDYSSVFFVNIFLALLIYLVLFYFAPMIAWFYHEEQLTIIMRVLSLSIVFGSFSAVHNALLVKELAFKKSFIRNAFNIVTQGVVGISLACLEFGVWSLVLSKLAGTIIGTVVLVLTVKWKPSFTFSINRIKMLFGYSSKVLSTNLLNALFNNIHSLIIGKFFSTADLGFFQRGQQIPQTVMGVFDGSINEVLYPSLSIIQNDKKQLKKTLRQSMRVSMYVCMPLMLGLIVISKDLTVLLLTEKWLASVPYMQLSCLICVFFPLSARMHALNAMGRSDITFKISMISKSISFILIILTVNLGMIAMMIGTITASCFLVCLVSYYMKIYINYTYRELVSDIIPSMIASSIMIIFVLSIILLNLSLIYELFFQIIVGAFIYVYISKYFDLDGFNLIIRHFKK